MHPKPESRLAELDGLRGVAIALVMLGHFTMVDGSHPFDLPFMAIGALGWIGVDLFFVLSGFLITGILLDTRRDPQALGHFYGRRALRILPVYYTLLALYTFVFPAIFPGGTSLFPAVWIAEPIWYWTFLSNFLVAFSGEFPTEVMAVAWSLAIEEQFYLIWPWIVRAATEVSLKRVCYGVLVVTAALRLFLLASGWPGVSIYVFTPTRLDALAAGALIAIARRSPAGLLWLRRWRGHAALWGFVVLGLCLVADGFVDWTDARDRWLTVLSFPALAAFFFGLVAWTLEKDGPLARRLRWQPLVTLGQWSFPIYLLNNTLTAAVMRSGWDPNTWPGGLRYTGQLGLYVGLFILCAAVGGAIHHVVERPCLRLKAYLPRSPSEWHLPPLSLQVP